MSKAPDNAGGAELQTVEYQRRPNDFPDLPWEKTTKYFATHETNEEAREFWDVRELVDRTDASRLLAQKDAELQRLRDALRMLYDDTASYIELNKLGGMDNQCMRLARAALNP